MERNEERNEIEKWDELEIKSDLLRGIYAYGFEEPSNIQKKAIVPIIQGKDVIAQAQSGSGKTGSFSIGTLQCIDIEKKTPQVLILSPTRELTVQTANVIKNIGSLIKNLRIKTVFGGSNYDDIGSFSDKNTPQIILNFIKKIIY